MTVSKGMRQRKIKQDTQVVIYRRVSQADNDEKNGIEVQQQVSQAYCDRMGYTIVGILTDDGVSGAIPLLDRVGLSEAYDMCLSGKATRIIAYNQDRFARKIGVFETIRETAQRYGITLETSDGRILTDKKDEIIGDVLAFAAAIERKRIAERFYEARKVRSKKDGMGSGPLPYGYMRDTNGNIVIDDTAATTVRMVLKLRETLSYSKTVAALNDAGISTPEHGAWGNSSIQRIEKNRALYTTGIRVWDGITATEAWPIIYRKDGE